MSLEGAKLTRLDGDAASPRGDTILAHGNSFKFGYYMDCDVILMHPDAMGLQCSIDCDAFGRVTIENRCPEQLITLNGSKLLKKRPLLHNTEICILDKKFLWQFEGNNTQSGEFQEDVSDYATPSKIMKKAEQPPNSEPSRRWQTQFQRRLTIHSFAFCIKAGESPKDVELTTDENKPLNTYEQLISIDVEQPTSKSPLPVTANLIDIKTPNALRRSNATPQTPLSFCKLSETVITSYSPRETGVRPEKSFALVQSPFSTPKKMDASIGVFQHLPSPLTKNHLPSMHLIDLTTPKKRVATAVSPARTLLKSTLKKNIPSTPTNHRRHSTAETSATSMESVYSVPSTDDESVIELSDVGSCSPSPVRKTPLRRTPQSLMKHAILSSAKKAAITKRLQLPDRPTPSKILFTPPAASGVRFQSQSTPQRKSLGRLHLLGENDKASHSVKKTMITSTPFRGVDTAASRRSILRSPSISLNSKNKSRQSLMLKQALKSPQTSSAQKRKSISFSEAARGSPLKSQAIKARKSVSFIHRIEIEDNNQSLDCNEEKKPQDTRKDATFSPEKEAKAVDPEKNEQEGKSKINLTFSPPKGVNASGLVKPEIDEITNTLSDKGLRINVTFSPEKIADGSIVPLEVDQNKKPTVAAKPNIVSSPIPAHELNQQMHVIPSISTPTSKELELSEDFIAIDEEVALLHLEDSSCEQEKESLPVDDLSVVEEEHEEESLLVEDSPAVEDDHEIESSLVEDPPVEDGDVKSLPVLGDEKKVESLLVVDSPDVEAVNEIKSTPVSDNSILDNNPTESRTRQSPQTTKHIQTSTTMSTPCVNMRSNMNIIDDDDFEGLDSIFKTPKAMNIMILGTPKSISLQKTTPDSVELVHSTEFDLSANLDDIFKTPQSELISRRAEADTTSTGVTNIESYTSEEAFDMLVGRPLTRKTYTPKVVAKQKEFSPLDGPRDTNLPKTDIEDWIDNVNQSIQLLQDDDSDEDEMSYLTANQSELSRDPLMMSAMSAGSVNTTNKKKPITKSAIDESAMTIMECDEDELEESATPTKDPLEMSIGTNQIKPQSPNISGIDLLDHTSESLFSEALEVSGESNNSNKTLECVKDENAQECTSELNKDINISPDKARREMEEAFKNFEKERKLLDGKRMVSTPEPKKSISRVSRRKTLGNQTTFDLFFDVKVLKRERDLKLAFENFEEDPQKVGERICKTPELKKIERKIERKTMGNHVDGVFNVEAAKSEREIELAFENFKDEPEYTEKRLVQTPKPEKKGMKDHRRTMGNMGTSLVPHEKLDLKAVKAQLEMELAFQNFEEDPEIPKKREVKTPEPKKSSLKDHRRTMGTSLVPQEKLDLKAAKAQLEMELAFANFEGDTEIPEKREVQTPEPKKISLKDHRRTMGTSLVPQEKLDLKACKAQREMELAFENFVEDPEIPEKREFKTPEPKKSSQKDHRRTMGTSLVPQDKLDLKAAKAQREMELAFENFEEDPEIPENREVKTPEPKKSSLKDHRRTMGTSLVPQDKLDLKAAKAQLEMELVFENFEEDPEIPEKREVQTPEPKKISLKDHRRTMGTSLVPQEKLDLKACKAQREMELAFENFVEDPEIPEKREFKTPEPKKSSLKDHRRTMGTSLVPQDKLDLKAAKAQREMELAFENFEEDPEIPENREVKTPEPKKSSLKDHRRTMGTSLVPQDKLDLKAAKAQLEMELAFENFEEDPEIPEKREVQTPGPKKSSLKDHRRTMGTSLVPQEKLDLKAAMAQREMDLAFENFEEDPEIPENREVKTPEPKKSSLKDHRRTMGTSLVPQDKLDLKAAKAQLEMELAFENFEEDPELPEKREAKTPEPKKSSLKDHRRTMGTSLVPQEKLDLKAAKAQLEMELAFENFEEDPEIPEKREVQTPGSKKSSLKDHRRTMGTSLVPQDKLDLKAAKAQLEMELAFENFEEDPELPEKREAKTPEPKKSSLNHDRRTMGTSLVPQGKLDLKAAKAQLEMELAFENFEEDPEIPEKREVQTPGPKKSPLKDHRRTMGTSLVPQEKLDLKAAKAQREMELAFENFEEDPEIPENREVKTPEPKKSSLKDHRRTMGTSLVPQDKLDLKAAKAQLEMELAFENFEEDPEIPEKREVKTPEPKKSSLKDHRRTMGTSLVPQDKLDLKAAKAQLEMELAFENFEEDPEIPEKRKVQTPGPKKSLLKDHRRTMGTSLVPQEKLDLKAAKAQREMELAFENFEEAPEIPEKREAKTPEPKKSSLKDHRRTMGTSLVPQDKLDLKAAKAQLEMELAFENFEEDPEIPDKREVKTPEAKKSSLNDHRRTMGTSLVPQVKLDLKAAKAQLEMELAFENFEEYPEIPEKREVKTPELALVEELKRDSDDENKKPLTREPKDVLSTGQEDAIIPESGDDVEVSSQAPNKEDVSKAYVTNTSQPKTRRRRRNDEDLTLESQTQAKQVRTKRDRQKSVVCVLIDSSQQDFVLPPKENTSSRKRNPSENASLVAETATHSLRKLRKTSTSEDELTSCNKKITTITVAPSLQPEDGSHHHLESIAEEDKNMVPHKALLNLNAEADEISSSPNPSNNRIRGRRVQLSVVLVENKDDRRIIEEKSVQATKEKGDPPTIKSDGDEIIPCTPASSKIRGRRTAKKANSELNPAVRLDSHGSVKQEVERNEGQVESSHEGDLQAETTIKNPTTAEEEPIDESVPSTPAPTKTRGRRQAIRAKSNNSLDRLTTNRTIEAVEFSEIRPEESIQKTKDVQDAVVQGGEGSETPKESANADIPHVAVEDISEVQYKDVEVCVATETVAETSAPTRKARRRKLSETVVEDHPTPNVAYSKKEDDGETRLENNTRPASRKTAVADSKAHKDESTNETETETLDQSSDVSSLVKVDSMAPKAIESQPKVEKSDVKTDVNLEEAVAPKARGRRLKLVENSTPQSSEVPKGRSRRAPLQTPESLTTNSIPKDDVKPIVDILSSGKAEEVVIEKSRGRRVKLDENPTPQLSEVPNGRGRRVVIKTDQKKSVSARKGNRRAALADESHEKEEQHSSENAFPVGETILCDEAAPRDDDVQQGERDSKNAIPWAHIEEATVVPTNAATECSSVNQSYAVEVDSTAPPPLTAVPIPGEDIKPMVDIPSSEDNAEKQVTEKSRSRRLKLVENSTPQSSEAPKGRMRRDALKTEPKENVPARKGSRRGARADTSHKEDSMIPYNEANQKDVNVETDLNSESVIPEDNPPPPGVDTQDDAIPLTSAQLKTRGRRAPSRKGTRNGIVEQEIAVVRLTADTLKPRGQRAHLKDEDTVHHDIKAQREEVDSKEELSSKVAPSKTRGRKAAPKSELTEAVAIKSSPVSKTTRRGDEENVVEVHGTAKVDKIDEAVTSTPVPSKTRGRAGALKSEITGSTISMSVKKEEVSGDVNVNADSTPEEGNAQQKEDDIEEVVLSTPEPSKLRARRQVLTADPTKSKVLTPVRGRSRKAVVKDDPEVHTDVSEPIVSADASSHAMRNRGRKGAAEQETDPPIYDKPSRVETIEPTTENLSVGRRKGRRGATEQDPEIHAEDNDIEKVDQASTEHVTGGRKRGRQGAADHAIEIQTEDDDVEKEISSKLSKHQAPIKSELIEAEPQDSDVHTDEVGSAVPRKKRRRVAAIKSEPTESAAESSTPVRKRGRRGAAQEEESTATTKTEISDVDEVHSSSTKPSRALGRQAKLKLESTAESIIPKNRRGNKAIAIEPANQGDAKKSEEESNDSTPTPSKPETSKPLRSRKASAKEISEEEEQPKNDVETKPIRGRRGAQKKDKPVDSTTSQTEEEHTSPIKTTTARARKPNAKSEPEQSKPTRGRKPHTSEEVTVPTDDDIEQNTSTVDEEPTKKPTRGRKGLQVENIIAENSQPTSVTKKTTRGRQPAAIDSDDENSSQIEAHTNPTRTRKVQQKNEENPAAAPKRKNRRNIEVVTEDEQSTPSKRIRRKPNKLLNDEFVI